ncbi:Uncharacterized protein FWK35_00030741 [Aphis craccivora]|uniref:Uncharacterized protein n=1 Tax=Aphis craccivora TaxID=307492 RepID=A0A6G0Y9A0_APHCR|nr:Uncharacterized protein FWK35_00030741 [Aphis craccivora]
MKLYLLLVVAVLVGLASSKPMACKKDEYELVDMCEEHCVSKEGHHNFVIGICKVSSKFRVYYDNYTKYFECWKCTGEPL